MKTRCIVIDDEPIAADILEMYIKNMPDLILIAKCKNAVEAFRLMQAYNVDLVFLDIQMPQVSGLDFLKSLNNPPKVIITTAFRKYAIEGFELNVVDYLLKPISFERFLKAVDKYYHVIKTQTPISMEVNSLVCESPFIYVKANRKTLKVHLDEILYIESLKDYVIIYLKDQKVITKQFISHFEDQLPKNLFLRIHRSYIVSINKIDSVSKSTVEIGKKELPISRNYKNEVLKTLHLEKA